ncbi:MAG: ABC transporter ATP-binding protein, partial [Sulfurospirillum sp.]
IHKAKSTAKELSGGEKQRCAIARALVNNPKVILCDEPTANLDKSNALAFIEVIKKLKQEGYTILIATHDTIFERLHEVDKVIHIENGEVL